MKKMKIWIVSILTVILSLFCLASCGETGKWAVTKYKAGPVSIDADSGSYIEMNFDKTIKIVIDIAGVSIEREGTWEKSKEEENTYILTFENTQEKLTIEDGVMTYGIYQLEKK